MRQDPQNIDSSESIKYWWIDSSEMMTFPIITQLNEYNRKAYKLAQSLMMLHKTQTEIARELNDGGYKTSNGKQWHTIQVQRLIALYEK